MKNSPTMPLITKRPLTISQIDAVFVPTSLRLLHRDAKESNPLLLRKRGAKDSSANRGSLRQ